MSPSLNHRVWNKHYQRKRSELVYPDEYVVSQLSHIFQKNQYDLSILDLGCGNGRHLNFLQHHSSLSFGQDFIFDMLQKNTNLNFKGKLVCAKAENLPFQDNSFDIVLAWGVLHYLSSSETFKAISEIHRVLKPMTFFLGTLRSKRDTHLSWVLKKGDLKTGKAQLYTKKKTIQLFTKFSEIHYGAISRELLGTEKIISHHVIKAIK